VTRHIKGSRCTHTIQNIMHNRRNTGGYNSSDNGVQSATIPRFVAPAWRHHLDASALPLWERWTRLVHNFEWRATSYWILLLVVHEGWWVFLPKPFRPWQSPRSDPASDSNSIRCDRPASTRARPAAVSILSSGTTRLHPQFCILHHLLPPFGSWSTSLHSWSPTVFTRPSSRPTQTLTLPPVHVIPPTNHTW